MNYQIIRSKRKTLSLQINQDAELIIRAPQRLADKEIQAFIAEKSSWIERKQQQTKFLKVSDPPLDMGLVLFVFLFSRRFLENQKELLSQEDNPKGWNGDWSSAVMSVNILGKVGDGRIEGLEGPRSICSAEGIERADVILVPLEDGDRCEALINLGKQVLVVDLNPLSRTAKMATVTIVDEISRAAELLLEYTIKNNQKPTKWNNNDVLNESLEIIASNADI